MDSDGVDERYMRLAVANGQTVRLLTPPNPWVGSVVVTPAGDTFQGATQAPGGAHAEIEALQRAGAAAQGATLYTTLEPCAHQGRTGPCVEAIIAAGIARVVIGVQDPDANVSGKGTQRLGDAGIAVTIGILADEINEQLRSYLTHRRTGRPYVLLKLAITLDGFIAAADGSSKWITGAAARADAHRLRAESDAVVVGAGTARADDPALTVRDFRPVGEVPVGGIDPLRVVLGRIPPGAKLAPAWEWQGELGLLLDALGRHGVLQLLVEGGGGVAGDLHRADLIDEYVFYVAPAVLGGADGRAAFAGLGAPTMGELVRGRFHRVEQLGDDLRIVLRRGSALEVPR